MEKHNELSDLDFKKQFQQLSLAPALFTHEAHLRLAWIHIQQTGPKKAATTICDQILRFATKHGDPGKFNKTVTIAAVQMVYHFMQKSTSKSFTDFIKEFPRLKNNFKELIASHYSWNIFTADHAKKEYVAPDLLPFT